MLYNILHGLNLLLLRFNCEIRKTQRAPFYYYLQHFKTPNLPHEHGIYTIPIDKIISPHGFSYGHEGWHYYTACLKEYQKNPEVTYANSVVKKYYDSFQPQTVADILFCGDPTVAPEILKEIPALLIRDFWRLNGSLQDIKSHLLEEETQLFGPISEIYGEEQFIRCLNAYHLIKKHGYIPDRFEDGTIDGYFLINDDDYRFIAMTGKHRLAALSILGHNNIKSCCTYNLKSLDLSEIEQWPTVKSGLFTPPEMQEIVQKYFYENGTTFAQKYMLSE